MQTDEIIREILKSIRFRNTDIESDSHYLLNTNRRGRPIQIRVSNHGTYLRTWVDLANGKDSQMRLVDPSTSINISIVFVDAGNNLTKDCINPNCDNCAQAICKPSIVKGITSKNRQYSVLQYTYQSEMINNRYLKSIINAINRASIGGRYIDPLNNLQLKRAKVKSMTSHDSVTEENNSINLQYNMKQKIRLTEGDLHWIIRNCINEALNEIESENIDEGFGNWVQAGINGLSNIKNYSQGPSNSKLVNWTDNVRRAKQNYDDLDTVQKAQKYGYQDAPKVQMAQARRDIYREPGSNRQVSDKRRSQAYQTMINAGQQQRNIDSRKQMRQYDQNNGTNLYNQRYGR